MVRMRNQKKQNQMVIVGDEAPATELRRDPARGKEARSDDDEGSARSLRSDSSRVREEQGISGPLMSFLESMRISQKEIMDRLDRLETRFGEPIAEPVSHPSWNRPSQTQFVPQPSQIHNQTTNYSEQTEAVSHTDVLPSRVKDIRFASNLDYDTAGAWGVRHENADVDENVGALSTPRLDMNGLLSSGHLGVTGGIHSENGVPSVIQVDDSKLPEIKTSPNSEAGPSIPQILHSISLSGELNSSSKREALEKLVKASVSNDPAVWTKYFNQILTSLLEVLEKFDFAIKELLLLITEMLKNQKDAIEESLEIIIEKLLHASKDTVLKVAIEADNCLTFVLSQYDPFRCLNVIVPLLATEDEKTLVTSINSLTKLVGRLSQEELMAQLPSLLPGLFDAFGNQSDDVRKRRLFFAW